MTVSGQKPMALDTASATPGRDHLHRGLGELAGDLTGILPDGDGIDEAITSLSGTFASAFARDNKAG